MTTHVMLDLETLDTKPSSQILTIGAVKFSPFNLLEPRDDFYYRFELDEQMGRERTVSESTMDWWSKQDDEIINEAFGDHNRHDVNIVLRALKKYMVGVDKVWSQGIAFDIPMLEDICTQFNEPIPWAFWAVEDCRTMLNRMPTDPRKDFTFAAHNALEDARVQAKALQKTFKHFNMTK